MKKLVVMFAIIIAMVEMGFAQNVEFGISGDAMYSSKNASTGTGLVFSEDPAVILHVNTTLTYNKWGVSAFYSGYTGLERFSVGDQYHIVDLLASYTINDEFTVYVGPEFTYKDVNDTDIVGSGLIGMVTWNRNKISSSFIYYTDPKFTIHYFIGSVNYNIVDNFSTYALVAYTTAEPTPVFGMVGVKYSKDVFFTGVYYAFRDNAPGPFFNVGFKF